MRPNKRIVNAKLQCNQPHVKGRWEGSAKREANDGELPGGNGDEVNDGGWSIFKYG